ncbi:MAG: SDR family oxidoreductase [Flavobacterium sp.]|nr:SDR family oxidoreductase [Candidatus Neoflavobacterium equi]
MTHIKDKTVLITGGASGIGKIMARKVLEKGGNVILWDINPQGLDQTKNELETLGTIATYVVDISNIDTLNATAIQTLKDHPIVDILINNAGIVVGTYFHEHTQEQILKTMSINANAPMLISSHFLPLMIQRNSGHICTIASSASFISNPKMAVYAASKWAAFGWSDSVRIEMKKLKSAVKISTVTPYYINTGMFDGVKSLIPILDPEKTASKIIRGIEKNTKVISMPWNMQFIRFFQGIFTINFFDWFVGDILGIYKTMKDFKGRS